jgi:hypothetical protein
VNHVLVRTNDPERSEVRLTLEGAVVVRYQIIPEAGLLFPTFARGLGGTFSARAEVFPATEPPPGEEAPPALIAERAVARLLDTPSGVTIASVRGVERDGRKGLAVECSIRGDAPVGTVDGRVALSTGNPLQPEVLVRVSGTVQPAIQAIPPRLELPCGEVGAFARTQLAGSRPFDVLAVTVAAVAGAELAVDVGSGGVLHLRVARGAPRPGAGELLAFLSDREVPLVRIPYRFRDVAAERADIEAHAAAQVRVTPSEVDLGDVDPQRGAETTVVIARSGAAPLEPGDFAVAPPGALDVSVEPIAAGHVARLIVRCPPGPPGPLAARVTFAPRPGHAPIALRVSGRLLPSVAVTPPALLVVGGQASETVLSRRGGLHAISAEDPEGRLDLELRPGPCGTTRLLATPRSREPLPRTTCSGAVIVHTDVPGEEEVFIPVAAR